MKNAWRPQFWKTLDNPSLPGGKVDMYLIDNERSVTMITLAVPYGDKTTAAMVCDAVNYYQKRNCPSCGGSGVKDGKFSMDIEPCPECAGQDALASVRPTDRDAVLEEAIKKIQKLGEDHATQYGQTEGDTGATVFPGNHEDIALAYIECEEAIRALKSAPASAKDKT